MRVWLISCDFPNPYEPTKGTFNLCLARAMARGHEVRVVSPVSWKDELSARRKGAGTMPRGRRETVDGVDVHYPRYYYPPGLLRNHYHRFFGLSVRRTVRRLAAEHGRPDVVLGYWAHPDGAVATQIAHAAGAPAGIIVGGSDVLLMTRAPGRRRRIVAALRATDAVLTVNAHLKDKTAELGIDPAKIHVWHQGVDLDRFHPGDRAQARAALDIPSDRPVAVWIGRMVHVKGLDVLLAACKTLVARGDAFRLYLVGDGELRGPIESTIHSTGLVDHVFCVGSRRQDQLPDWYRAADITVLPSRSEGLPNVLRESLACGTPFVASAVGGIPEVAAGSDSLLVPPADSAALADALATAFARDGAARSPAAFKSVSWTESAENLLDIMRPLVNADRPATTSPQKQQPASGIAAGRPNR